MQVTSSTSSAANAAAATSTTAGTTGNAASTLGQADFLKLLTVQLQQQDPMKPMDDSAFIAQMAQFSSLQQMTTLNTGMQNLRNDAQLGSATNLIGAQVTVATSNNSKVSGVVSGVSQTSTGAEVTINGISYPYTSITKVTVPTTSPTSG